MSMDAGEIVTRSELDNALLLQQVGEAISAIKQLTRAMADVPDAKPKVDHSHLKEDANIVNHILKEIGSQLLLIPKGKVTFDIEDAAVAGKEISNIVGDIGEKIGEIKAAGGIGPAVAIGAAAAAAALTTLLVTLLAIGQESEKLQRQIGRQTGENTENVHKLFEAFHELFAGMPEGAKEIIPVLEVVDRRLDLTGHVLEAVTKDIIIFTRVLGGDAKKNAQDLTGALASFNVPAEDMHRVLALVASTIQASGAEVDDFVRGLRTAGPVFQELGLNIDQSIALLGRFAKIGIESQTALLGLRSAGTHAAKAGVDVKTAFIDLIQTIATTKDEQLALDLATESFSQRGAALLFRALRDNKLAADELTEPLEKVRNAVDPLNSEFSAAKLPMEQFAVSLHRVEVALEPAAKALLDFGLAVSTGGLNVLAAAIENLGSHFNRLGAGIQGIGPLLGDLGNIYVTVASTIGSFVKTVADAAVVLEVFGGKLALIGATGGGGLKGLALDLNSFSGLSDAIGQLAGNFRVLESASRGSVSVISDVGQAYRQLTQAINAVGLDILGRTIGSQVQSFVTLEKTIGEAALSLDSFGGKVSGFSSGVRVLASLITALGDAYQNLSGAIATTGVAGLIPDLSGFSSVIDVIGQLIGNFTSLDSVVRGAVGVISALDQAYQNLGKAILDTGLSVVGTLVNAQIQSLVNFAKAVGEATLSLDAFGGKVAGFASGVRTLATIIAAITDAYQALRQNLSQALSPAGIDNLVGILAKFGLQDLAPIKDLVTTITTLQAAYQSLNKAIASISIDGLNSELTRLGQQYSQVGTVIHTLVEAFQVLARALQSSAQVISGVQSSLESMSRALTTPASNARPLVDAVLAIDRVLQNLIKTIGNDTLAQLGRTFEIAKSVSNLAVALAGLGTSSERVGANLDRTSASLGVFKNAGDAIGSALSIVTSALGALGSALDSIQGLNDVAEGIGRVFDAIKERAAGLGSVIDALKQIALLLLAISLPGAAPAAAAIGVLSMPAPATTAETRSADAHAAEEKAVKSLTAATKELARANTDILDAAAARGAAMRKLAAIDFDAADAAEQSRQAEQELGIALLARADAGDRAQRASEAIAHANEELAHSAHTAATASELHAKVNRDNAKAAEDMATAEERAKRVFLDAGDAAARYTRQLQAAIHANAGGGNEALVKSLLEEGDALKKINDAIANLSDRGIAARISILKAQSEEAIDASVSEQKLAEALELTEHMAAQTQGLEEAKKSAQALAQAMQETEKAIHKAAEEPMTLMNERLDALSKSAFPALDAATTAYVRGLIDLGEHGEAARVALAAMGIDLETLRGQLSGTGAEAAKTTEQVDRLAKAASTNFIGNETESRAKALFDAMISGATAAEAAALKMAVAYSGNVEQAVREAAAAVGASQAAIDAALSGTLAQAQQFASAVTDVQALLRGSGRIPSAAPSTDAVDQFLKAIQQANDGIRQADDEMNKQLADAAAQFEQQVQRIEEQLAQAEAQFSETLGQLSAQSADASRSADEAIANINAQLATTIAGLEASLRAARKQLGDTLRSIDKQLASALQQATDNYLNAVTQIHRAAADAWVSAIDQEKAALQSLSDALTSIRQQQIDLFKQFSLSMEEIAAQELFGSHTQEQLNEFAKQRLRLAQDLGIELGKTQTAEQKAQSAFGKAIEDAEKALAKTMEDLSHQEQDLIKSTNKAINDAQAAASEASEAALNAYAEQKAAILDQIEAAYAVAAAARRAAREAEEKRKKEIEKQKEEATKRLKAAREEHDKALKSAQLQYDKRIQEIRAQNQKAVDRFMQEALKARADMEAAIKRLLDVTKDAKDAIVAELKKRGVDVNYHFPNLVVQETGVDFLKEFTKREDERLSRV